MRFVDGFFIVFIGGIYVFKKNCSDFLRVLKNFLLRVCKGIDEIEKNRSKRSRGDFIFVSLHDDGVYVNNLKVIDKRAVLQIAILKILLEKHLIGSLYSTSTGLTADKISTILRMKGIMSFDAEKQIRQSIYRIKKNVSPNCNKEIGANFIQSLQTSNAYKLDKNVRLI